VTTAWVFPATTAGGPETPGARFGVDALPVYAADVPLKLVAVEVKVYSVPLVSPVTSQNVAGGVTVQVAPPGEAVIS
jgi:hypothetical protein